MKTRTITLMMLLAAAVSCQKNVETSLCPADLSGKPITFSVNSELPVSAETKSITDVTATTLPSIYVAATSGDAGSAETAWSYLSNAKVDLTSGAGVSGAYWPVSGNLNFYATNFSFEPRIDRPGCSFLIEYGGGQADYVAGVKTNVTNGSNVSLEMHHILSRLYDLKFKVEGENATATITQLLIYYTGKGLYDFKGNNWSLGSSNPPAQVVTPTTKNIGTSYVSVGQSVIDRTFIPGNIAIKVSYTVKAPGYSKDFTKEAIVPLAQGVKTTVSAVLSDDKKPISFNVSVAPWATEEYTAVLK